MARKPTPSRRAGDSKKPARKKGSGGARVGAGAKKSEWVTLRDSIAADFAGNLTRMKAIARDKKHPKQFSALRWMMEQVIGKAPETIEVKQVSEFDPEHILSRADVLELNADARE